MGGGVFKWAGVGILFALSPLSAWSATLKASDYGVQPNTGAAVDAGIRTLLGKVKSGDVITFASGDYIISSAVALKSGVTLQSATLRGARFKMTPGKGHVFTGQNLSSVTIDGLVFDGGALKIENSTAIKITRNVVQNIQWASSDSASYSNGIFLNDVSGLVINGNLFQASSDSDTSVIGWGLEQAELSDNTFDDVHEGIHILSGEGVKVLRNVLTRVVRMGIEIQYETNNLEVAQNWLSDYAYNAENSDACIGLSIVPDDGQNISIHDNFAAAHDAKFLSQTTCLPMGLEVAGKNVTVQNNHIDGWISGIIFGNASGTIVVKNNKLCGVGSWPIGTENGFSGNDDVIYNQVASNTVSAKFCADDPKPTAAGTTTPTPPVTPTPPTVKIPVAPTSLSGQVTGSTIALSWRDNSDNETQFLVRVNGTIVGKTAANAKSFTIQGLSAQKSYSVSVSAANSAGESKAITGTFKTSRARSKR